MVSAYLSDLGTEYMFSFYFQLFERTLFFWPPRDAFL